MEILRTPNAMRAWSREQRHAGRSIGFVPTMGALHAGHASLMQAAVEQNEVAVLSIFVNPAQFAPHEDYARYPRMFETDCGLAREMGMKAVYAPTAETMYREGYTTYVTVESLDKRLCSVSRPHFFRGVATVVAKLFNAVEPDRAYFGQKDAQQCAIIKRMVADLDMPIVIVEMPIVREADGLAMSSRNQYLSSEERAQALNIWQSLRAAQDMMTAGERDPQRIVAGVRDGLSGLDIDYVELLDSETLDPVTHVSGTVLLAVAATVGKTRLIDNIKFDVPTEDK